MNGMVWSPIHFFFFFQIHKIFPSFLIGTAEFWVVPFKSGKKKKKSHITFRFFVFFSPTPTTKNGQNTIDSTSKQYCKFFEKIKLGSPSYLYTVIRSHDVQISPPSVQSNNNDQVTNFPRDMYDEHLQQSQTAGDTTSDGISCRKNSKSLPCPAVFPAKTVAPLQTVCVSPSCVFQRCSRYCMVQISELKKE